MRTLLTGATGYIGSSTCATLVSLGYDVVATDIRPTNGLPVKVRSADLLDIADVYRVMEDCEAVVHFGNHPNPGRCYPPQRLYAENDAMTVNVFQAAADLGIRRIVYASSVQAISGTRYNDEHRDRPSVLQSLPIDSSTPAHPGNLYAMSKAAGEHLLAFFADLTPSLSATALRIPYTPTRSWFPDRLPTVGAGWLDEGMTYLDVADIGPLVDCVLRANLPGYRHILPCAGNNRLGWDAEECLARYYANVPLRRPITGKTALVDVDEIDRLYGWRAAHPYDLARWDPCTPPRRHYPFG